MREIRSSWIQRETPHEHFRRMMREQETDPDTLTAEMERKFLVADEETAREEAREFGLPPTVVFTQKPSNPYADYLHAKLKESDARALTVVRHYVYSGLACPNPRAGLEPRSIPDAETPYGMATPSSLAEAEALLPDSTIRDREAMEAFVGAPTPGELTIPRSGAAIVARVSLILIVVALLSIAAGSIFGGCDATPPPECLSGGQVAVGYLCASDPSRATCFLPCRTAECQTPTPILGCTLPFASGAAECVAVCP